MEINRFVFSPIEVNSYILSDMSGNCAVIDCGCYNKDEFSTLTSFIEMHGYKPVMLLNTHCHLDHIFGNRMFLEKYNLRTHFLQLEEKNRKNSVQHAMLFGLKMELPPGPEAYLTDGQIITFGSVSLKALHVPGHTEGSLAYYCKDENVVFTGDALFEGSIGRTDLPGGNYETLIKSIREKLFTLPPETVVYPGHGEATTIGNEMKNNPFLR